MKNTLLLISIFLLLISASDNKNEKNKEEPIGSVFKGKNLVTFGNSITAAKSGWAYQVSEKLQFGNLYNGAVGGAIWSKRERMIDGKTIRTQNYSDPDFAGISNGYSPNPNAAELQKRINNCAIVHIQKYLCDKTLPTPDLIILSYGTNDSSTPSVMGNAETVLQEKDLKNVDLFTMAGAIRWSIETLMTEFPKTKLYISFPIQAASDSKNKGNLEKIAIIKQICDELSVPYFDCYAECEIKQENQDKYLRDGLHPNEAGNKVHGSYIIMKLEAVNE